MDHAGSTRAAPLTRAELEIELGRLALLLGNAVGGPRAFAARRAGAPSPVVGLFLEACEDILAKTTPAHRGFVIRRLDRMAAAAGLGLVGLAAWLGDPALARSDGRPRRPPPPSPAAPEPRDVR